MIFVTGTDTGVGKTSFTVWLLTRLRERGVRCAGYKPICCGDRNDAIRLQSAGDPDLTLDEVNPVWLQTPAAPLVAARTEKRSIDWNLVRDGFLRLKQRFDFVAVEGVGGWMVPITSEYLASDLARDLGLPVIVVAANRLGCLNHTLLTVGAIQTSDLRCAGVILNDFQLEPDIATATNGAVLQGCLTVPVCPSFQPQNPQIPEKLRQMLPGFGNLL
ncbi:MAG: dethiobiotin synthase [Chthoniobacterales bacterium]